MPASKKKVRYAVVGLGHFGQQAVLPAYQHARDNSELTAFVSGDPEKHRQLGKRYNVLYHYRYDHYQELMESGLIDAVYIVLPNHLHAEYTIKAARAGVHVLCEKPLAVTAEECRRMIDACHQHNVKLMTAYRLHFETANLEIIRLVTSKKIGEPRYFSSVFSHVVKGGNIRAKDEVGGGGFYDLGVYCINAARYLFRSEPVEAFAITANTDKKRFDRVDSLATAILRFPNDRFAQFTVSQDAADMSQYHIVGTKGMVEAKPAYEYAEGLGYSAMLHGKTLKKSLPKRDQVAAEILYFSDCVLRNRAPEPSGQEGLADVRVVEALYESARSGKAVRLGPLTKRERPDLSQEINRPPVGKQELVKTSSPSV